MCWEEKFEDTHYMYMTMIEDIVFWFLFQISQCNKQLLISLIKCTYLNNAIFTANLSVDAGCKKSHKTLKNLFQCNCFLLTCRGRNIFVCD